MSQIQITPDQIQKIAGDDAQLATDLQTLSSNLTDVQNADAAVAQAQANQTAARAAYATTYSKIQADDSQLQADLSAAGFPLPTPAAIGSGGSAGDGGSSSGT